MLKQVNLLLGKNWILKRRAWRGTACEILVPVIVMLIVVIIRAQVKIDDIDEGLYLKNKHSLEEGVKELVNVVICGEDGQNAVAPMGHVGLVAKHATDQADVADLKGYLEENWSAIDFGPLPCDSTVTDVADYVNKTLFKDFASTDALDDYVYANKYATNLQNAPLMLALVLSRGDTDHQWDMLFRTNYTRTPPTQFNTNKFISSFDREYWEQYWRYGVVSLKRWADLFIMNEKLGKSVSGEVDVAPFPMRKTKKDQFKNYLGPVFGLFIVLPFMWPFSRMVRQLVDEKERRVKEGMKMMGLSGSAFWTSWYLTYLLEFFIIASVTVIVAKSSVYKYSDGLLLWIFYMAFMTSLLGLGMIVTSLFNRAKTAGTLSLFALFGLWLPYFAVSGEDRSPSSKVFASLLSPIAFSLGQDQYLQYESSFLGITWENMNEETNNFRFFSGLVMLIFDSVLYVFVALYLDLVLPKEFGTRLPWYFPFTVSYWCNSGPHAGGPQASTPLLDEEAGDSGDINKDIKNEPVPAELEAKRHLSIRNLRRVFESDVGENVAVAGLDLDMYMGQIFVLLGHNGAGKSTTINMLTGMLAPSSGTARLQNLDINSDMNLIRQRLGVCPQHDILFPTLTVEEHLRFFGRLKGIEKGAALDAAVDESIREVQLDGSRTQFSDDLSGGQKRRLSLAIALIGDSQFVVLDEPTSGVDPFSRRAIWNLLSQKKQNRLIILTTHFMDEADQLGDRIGIMHKGKLKCVGSSLFLKRTYGVGYTMTLTKTPSCVTSAVRKLIKNHVNKCKELSNVGTELSFQLPLEASKHFPDLLSELDSRKDEVGVSNYGLSVTTLEEVFIKVAEEQADPEQRQRTMQAVRRLSRVSSERRLSQGTDEEDEDHPNQFQMSNPTSSSRQGDSPDGVLYASDKYRTPMRDFKALLAKRFHIIKRDRKALLFQLAIPLVVLCLGLGFLRIPPNFTFDSVTLNPSAMYKDSDVVFYNKGDGDEAWQSWIDHIDTASPYGLNPDDAGLTDYSDTILKQLLDHEFPYNQGDNVYGAYYVNDTASILSMDFTVLNNITANHAMPAYLAVADEALLRNITNDPTARITTTVHPFSFTASEKANINSANGILAAVVIAIAFCFVPASYVVFVVKDRENHSKHLQDISGVSRTMYWMSSFFWDYLTYLVPALLASFIILAFNNPPYRGANFPAVLFSFLVFGLAVIPFSYFFSFLFSSHSTAQNVMIMIYLVGGVVMMFVSFALYAIPSTRKANSRYVRHLFRLIPNFALSDSLFYLSIRALPVIDEGRWAMDVTGYNFVYMLIEAIVYFGLTLFVEHSGGDRLFRRLFGGSAADPGVESGDGKEDEDVVAERRRVMSGQADGEVITLRGMRKVFPGGRVAVHDLYYSIPAGECFGYLGVNGAGKTTSLRMLTGDVVPTRGTATLGGFDILEQPERVRRMMGYCPQFDALYEHMTAVEHLEFYGRIRGVPEEALPHMVDFLVERLTLTPHANRPAGTYSGGNKRKLSVGIALIGNPRVVFLDEPSTGMDPVSRRFMWDFISETMADRAVILTTHSMEECEALCQRIGILVQGRLRCIGSSQHLKSRYGRGYQLDISTGDQAPDNARQFVLSTFDGAEEIEAYGSSLKYKIPPQADLHLSEMFSKIEENKEEVGISEYSIGQTSLEQIFNMFAKAGDQEERQRLQLSDPSQYLQSGASAASQPILVPPQLGGERSSDALPPAKTGGTSSTGSFSPHGL